MNRVCVCECLGRKGEAVKVRLISHRIVKLQDLTHVQLRVRFTGDLYSLPGSKQKPVSITTAEPLLMIVIKQRDIF